MGCCVTPNEVDALSRDVGPATLNEGTADSTTLPTDQPEIAALSARLGRYVTSETGPITIVRSTDLHMS